MKLKQLLLKLSFNMCLQYKVNIYLLEFYSHFLNFKTFLYIYFAKVEVPSESTKVRGSPQQHTIDLKKLSIKPPSTQSFSPSVGATVRSNPQVPITASTTAAIDPAALYKLYNAKASQDQQQQLTSMYQGVGVDQNVLNQISVCFEVEYIRFF